MNYHEHFDHELDPGLESLRAHNQAIGQKLSLHIPVDNPVEREARRQRALINTALVALRQGDLQRARELLLEL